MADLGRPESAKADGAANPPSQPTDTDVAPRHCFICLSDDTDDATPQEWVTPCPCTLEGHQECMLTWVASREGDRRRLECPVCKAPISVSGPWNPVAALNDYWNVTVLHIAPWVLAGTTVAGVYAANFAYGIHSLATFAGPEAARAAIYTRWPASGLRDIRWSAAAVVAHLTPALVVLRLVPGLGVKTLPSIGATAIGIYKLVHSDFSLRRWPPSPWAALFFVICMRSAYFRLWKTCLGDWERRIDRKLENLPDEPEVAPDRQGPVAARIAVRNNGGGGVGIIGWILERLVLGLDVEVDDEARQARRARRQERRRRLRELRADMAQQRIRRALNYNDADPDVQELMNRLDALHVRMDEQFRAQVQQIDRLHEQGAGADAGEQQPAAAREDGDAQGGAPADRRNDGDNQQGDEDDFDEVHVDLGEIVVGDEDDEEINDALPRPAEMLDMDDDDDDDDNANLGANINMPAANNANANAPAPAAPAPAPARAVNIGLTIDHIIMETTISLLFPMICYSFGELLRFTVLPRSWTEAPSGGAPWARLPSGLLNKRWGRSLLGGCVFVVLWDAMRMYSKYSTLRNRAFKKVESVDRKKIRRGAA